MRKRVVAAVCRWALRGIAAGLVAGAIAGRLAAGGPPVDASPDGVIAFTEEGSSSDCIGHPVSPLCAALTLEACALRFESRLCAIAGRTRTFPKIWDDLSWRTAFTREYIVAGIGRVVPPDPSGAWPDFPNLSTNVSWRTTDTRSWRIGDTVIALRLRTCNRVGDWLNCDPWGFARFYIVRQAGDRWSFVSVYAHYR